MLKYAHSVVWATKANWSQLVLLRMWTAKFQYKFILGFRTIKHHLQHTSTFFPEYICRFQQ